MNDYSSFLLWHEVQRFLTPVEQEEVKRVFGWDKIEHNDNLYQEIISLVEILEPLVIQRKQRKQGNINVSTTTGTLLLSSIPSSSSASASTYSLPSSSSSSFSLSPMIIPSSTVKLLTKLRNQRIQTINQSEEQQTISSGPQNFEKIALQAQIIFFVEKLKQVHLPIDPTIQQLVQTLNNNHHTNNKEKSSSSSSRINSAVSRPTTSSSSTTTTRYSITSTSSSNSKQSTSTSSITNYLQSKETMEDIGLKDRLTEGMKLWDMQNIEVQHFVSIFKQAIREEEKVLIDDIQYLNQLLIQYADDKYNGILDDDDGDDDEDNKDDSIPNVSPDSTTISSNSNNNSVDDIPFLRTIKNNLQKLWLKYETTTTNNSSNSNGNPSIMNERKYASKTAVEGDPLSMNPSTGLNAASSSILPLTTNDNQGMMTTLSTTSTSKVSSRLRALRGLPTATEDTGNVEVMKPKNVNVNAVVSNTIDDEDKFFT